MENKHFTELTVDESLEIDAGSFAAVGAAGAFYGVVCYGAIWPILISILF